MSLKKEINRRSFFIKQEPGFLGRESEFCLDKIIPEYTKDLIISYKLVQKNGLPVKSVALIHKMPEILDLERILERVNHPIKNLLSVKDFFINIINAEEALVFLLDKPSPESLLWNNLGFFKGQREMILQQIIIPLLEVVGQLHNQGLAHNNINLKSIFVDIADGEVKKISLLDSLLELPGYSQSHTFEDRSRLFTHRAGKKYSPGADSYAIGFLLLALFSGNSSLKGSLDTIIHNKIHKGSYKAALDDWFQGDCSNLTLPIKIASFWLLQDNPLLRWTPTEALKFLRQRHKKLTINSWNKKTNFQQNNQPTFTLELNGLSCKSKTEAASLAINNYDQVKIKVKNGKLIKNLINNNNIQPSFISNISYLRALAARTNSEFLTKDDLFLTFFILALDSEMPLKIKDLTFDPEALWTFCNYLLHKDSNQLFYNSLFLISSGLLGTINEALDFLKISPIKFLLGKENLLKNYSNQAKKTFITAAMLPVRAFKSPLVGNKICFTSEDLLQLVNQLEEDQILALLENEKIITWLQAKAWQKKGLILTNPIDLISSLEVEPLPKIAKALVKLLPLEALGRNLSLRETKLAEIEKASQAGKINLIKKSLADKLLTKDKRNFDKDQNKIRKIEEDLDSCNRAIKDKEFLLVTGQNLTKKIAGAFLILTLLHLSYKLLWLM